MIITGDFNAKLGCKDFIGGPIGSFARGIRNANGDLRFDFLAKHKLLAANTFFKHKACQITTWEGYLRGKKVFNQLDYIIIQT